MGGSLSKWSKEWVWYNDNREVNEGKPLEQHQSLSQFAPMSEASPRPLQPSSYWTAGH